MTGVAQSVLPFVHPGIAGAALLAGLVPVLIHLISRRRYVRTPWAAMAFLLAANRRSARRMRLEQWLLMLLRIGVLLLLGAAVARPYVAASAILPTTFSRVHRVVVLDNSLSMSARELGERTRFSAAHECAMHLVGSFPPADAVSLVTLATPAEGVITHAAYDHRWVRETLSAVQPTQRTTDVVGAVAVVRQILKDSPAAAGNRVVYFISDFARADWQSPTPQQATASVAALRQLADAMEDSASNLYLIRVQADAQDNVAVTRLEPETSLVGLNVPIRVFAEVTNYGTTTLRSVSLQVRRDGLIVRRETLPALGPGASTSASVTTEFPTAGTHAIEARIASTSGNALEADDVRYLSLEAVEQRPVLLVDGRPGARSLDGQAGFLATALAPGVDPRPFGSANLASTMNLFSPKVVSEAELERETLAHCDAVALCNVARLTPAQWTRLERFVADGGGLLVALGELVSTENYNRLGYAEGRGLLPGRLGRVVDLHSTDDAGAWKLDARPDPIVTEFAGEPNSGLFRARVERYFVLEPDVRRAEVVLRYTDDAPALVSAAFGKGRVLLWTTSANMEWNNLPAKGDFVGLMHNVFTALVPRRGGHRNLLVGASVQEPLTPAETSATLSVRTIEGTVNDPSLAAKDDVLSLVYGPVPRAQFLTLTVGSQARTVAVNVDRVESDVTPLNGTDLAAAVARGARIVTDRELAEDQPVAARSTELASFALYAVLVLLLGELWLAMRFTAPHQGTARASAQEPPST